MAEIRCFDWGIHGKWQMQQKIETMIYETYMRVEVKRRGINKYNKKDRKKGCSRKTDGKWNKE